MPTAEMKTTAIVPYFGASRMIGEHVGRALEGCNHVVVPFAGSCAELAHIKARTIVCGDKNQAVLNLAGVAGSPSLGPKLYRGLRRVPHHELSLEQAQQKCREYESGSEPLSDNQRLQWAAAYFIASWMGRNGEAGKAKEFEAGFSVRYDGGGGDSAVRVRSATKSLIAWRRVLARATFVCMDAFELLEKVKDAPGCAVYIDAPWPDDGKSYRHAFGEADQRRLAEKLATFRETRVVVRYGDHPLIRELYPESRWRWQAIEGRTSGNNKKAEVLIVNRRSLNEQEGARLF